MGGVPEHFFYPWRKWIREKASSHPDFVWEWTDFPGGSGAMIEALGKKEIEFAFLLTESAAKAISGGAELEALSVFVESPLLWGIFSGANNPVSSVAPVFEKKYAISRFGSGSHLMAMVDARKRGEEIGEDQWVLAQNLEGAKKVLETREADLFFWEKWTTKPLVDQGIFRMIDICPSPWASFVLVCRKDILSDEEKMKAVRIAFGEVLEIAQNLKKGKNSPSEIAEEYGQKEKDAAEWLEYVKWVPRWTEPEVELAKAKVWI